MRNKKTPENRGAIQRRRWIKGSPKMTTGVAGAESKPSNLKQDDREQRREGVGGRKYRDRLLNIFEYLEKYCQMFNKYIENIQKIFAIVIKKKLSKIKNYGNC